MSSQPRDLDDLLAYDDEWPEEHLDPALVRKGFRVYDPEAARQRERKRGYVPNAPGVDAARGKVHYALKMGKIVRPATCEACGEEVGMNRGGRSRLHAHHDSYRAPLDIVWLCPRCHGYMHTTFGKGELDPATRQSRLQTIREAREDG